MRNLILALTVATTAALGGPSAASAWERNVTIQTDRGAMTGSAEVYCFDGACYREAELTGVNGNTLKHSGMCLRVETGEWDCKGTVTGPKGGSKTRTFHITVN